MKKVILTILGIFTISQAQAETVIATGTLSIEEMKRMIIKLKQENALQSARIDYLQKKVAKLEKEVKELKNHKKQVLQPVRHKPKHKLNKNNYLKSYCVIANLNVRKGPGISYEVIAWLKKGAKVSGTIKKGKWLKILSPSGWVSSLYLRECSNGRKEK